MRRAMSPATCTQVTSLPSRVCSHSALRSFSSDALSSAALRKAPRKYQRSLTTPSTGERFEWTLNTFMKTLTFTASRCSQGSRALPTSTTRPSAGDTTARGSSGTSRGGSRKNCTTKRVASQKGSDHHQPARIPTSSEITAAIAMNSQPSLATTGCGYGSLTSYFCSSSLSRSEPCPCFIASPTLRETLSMVFFGCWPMRRAASDSGTLSPQPATSNSAMKRLILRSVDKAVPFYPGHHFAQPGADLLDRQLGGHAPVRKQRRRPGAVLEHELLGVLAGLDARQHRAHALARVLIDDLRPRGVFAVLGVVRDRVVHGADAALVHQVNDQLQLVQALEVRHLGRIAGVDERIESRLHQLDAAAAQHRLLAEQVGLGLLLEIGFDDAGLAAADGRGVGERHIARLLRRVAVHRDQHRHAAARRVGGAHRMARRLGRDHPDVEVGARLDQAVVDVEAVREGERGAFLDIRLDMVLVHLGVVLVGQQDHDDVRPLDRRPDLGHLQSRLSRLVPGRAALAQADRHLDAGFLEVERVRVALRAVADDRHLLALDERKISVFVVIDLHDAPEKLDSKNAVAASDAARAGPYGLDDRALVERLDERVELAAVAGELDGVGVVGDVDDPAPEDVGHALHVLALLLAGAYFDQHELALDVLGLRQVDHLHHLDQLVQLLGDLLDHVLGAGRDDGHARHRRIFGRRHGERLDVVAAGGKQAGNAGQRSGLVLHENGDDVPAHKSSYRIISVMPLPPGIIG